MPKSFAKAQFIGLFVNNLDNMVDYYTEKLGFSFIR
ncbi:VOC family protein [Spirosoma soli]|uniref:VOC family protein n=1 Tax=Spirosoma soli TaxID=1770529 RepID=A0ABW5LWX1_9BACT